MHKFEAFTFVCAGLLGLALLLPRTATADWPDQTFVNVPLCTASGHQQYPASVPDGAGGAIVAWQDLRGGTTADIYVQRISATGAVQWQADGVALCTAAGNQIDPTIASDGAGGAIVTWQDNRGGGNYDIYARRISAAGAVQWAADGVALCTAAEAQLSPVIVSDGTGGAIVAWEDDRSGNADVYAQRVSAEGAVQWQADGVPLYSDPYSQAFPTIVSDDAHGAIVAWVDSRNISSNADVYAQRIQANGTVAWGTSVALCNADGIQTDAVIAADGAGGAIVAWYDWRSGTSTDIYAQEVSAAGTIGWTVDGVALCTSARDQLRPEIVADGPGGAIVVWQDLRADGSFADLYAQKVSAGAVQWTADGVPVCTATGDQVEAAVTSNVAGGAVVAWADYRNGDADIYAQGISATGSVQWADDGVALTSLHGAQRYPTLVSDGGASGGGGSGAIVAWQDYRNSLYSDLYAQRVWADGTTPVQLSLVGADVGADFVTLTWLAGGNGSSAATVYRSPVGGEWTRIAQVTADGAGYLRYSDPIDATAIRLGYRLGIVDAGRESFYGETWVDLPARDAAFAFSLAPVNPNPAQGGPLMVRFTLPSAAPARVELVDVGGRRVAQREVGSLGAGRHSLALGEPRQLAPGLYLVRLTQGANSRTTRVVVRN